MLVNYVSFILVVNQGSNDSRLNSGNASPAKGYKSVRFSPGLGGSPTPIQASAESTGQMSAGLANRFPAPDYQPEDNETYTFTIVNSATPRSFNESSANRGKHLHQRFRRTHLY